MLDAIRFLSISFTAISMSAGFAHLFALPNKMSLSRVDYFTVQQIYSGWALLGIAGIGALVSTVALSILTRHRPRRALTATANWTESPANWEALRRQWEYSHAAGAVLYATAFTALVLSVLGRGD